MKNNKITLSQFWFMSFLSSLVAVLFLGNNPTFLQLVSFVISQFAVFLVTVFYKGEPSLLLRIICTVYLGIFCVACACKFTDYMIKALGYEMYILNAAILLLFCFFSTVKGIEAFARASVIIGVFIIASIIYIFACAVPKINFSVNFNFEIEPVSALVMFFPAVLYVMIYSNIVPEKTPTRFIMPALSAVTASGFMLIAAKGVGDYPIQLIPEHSQLNVFKGADCLLLGFLTASVLYIISSSVLAVFGNSKHNYVTNSISCAGILILTIICLSYKLVYNIFLSEIFSIAVSGVAGLFILIEVLRNNKLRR